MYRIWADALIVGSKLVSPYEKLISNQCKLQLTFPFYYEDQENNENGYN